MSKETPKDDPRQKTDKGSMSRTDEPWKGLPEKDQYDPKTKPDIEKWKDTRTH